MTATPAPLADPELIRQEVERNYRWNFTWNVLDGATFWLGISFISTAVILPLYVSHFTSNPLIIGLIPFIQTAGTLLPQLFMANAVERAPRKIFFPKVVGFFLERTPIYLLAPTTLLLAENYPVLALVVFFILHTWHNIGAGVISVGWYDMIAKIIPQDRRGRFYGITNFIGNGTGILGAMLVPVVLHSRGFPEGFAISFGIAGALALLSWFFLIQTREPAVYSKKPPVSQTEYLRSLPEVVRKDRNFRTYLLAQIVFALSGMATGFLAVYAVRTWQMSDAQAGGFTIALQVGLALANLFFGFLADRKGHKLSLEICFGLNVLLLVLAVVAPSPAWFFVIFFLRGSVNAVTFLSGASIVYEFTDPDNRPTYIGLANTIPGAFGAVAPLIGGLLVGAVSYPAMFLLAAITGLASLGLLRFGVRDPRKM